ncbi:O-methylsterigmatocystin oxidoreductase [Trametes pubescens]|uniref:O-methylsterigmatocystin oxidoreductase n=1 Tax=Trametes pubescens TaxID=154538 RepID=A0A1M2VSH1_TRAPU|nr:O-methylsterigmatocystin oxidoreductase [Trametes pubescens]
MSTFTSILCAILAAILLAYRRSRTRRLGPLPPGPQGWPLIGNLLDMPTTYHWLTFSDWSQRWGDIVSVTLLGQPMVILNSPKDAMAILEKKSAITSDRASLPVAGGMIGWSRAMVLAPYGDRLREMRKMFAQVLASRQRFERFHALVEGETQHFLLGLRTRTDSLVRDLHRLAGSSMITITYGYKVRGDDDHLIQIVDKAMADFTEASAPGTYLADIFPFLCHIPSWVPGAQWRKKVAEQSKNFNRMVDIPFNWVKAQMNAGTALPSVASALLEGSDGPEKEELIKMASASLYAGGADTTVAAMASFFLAMSCFPEAQRKAQAEIDALIGNSRLPTLKDRDALPYLNALMLEVLRWIPVAPMGFPHQLSEDDFHEGYFLPKGTLVVANIWQFLHDPQTYADPMTFNPDRFVSTESKEAERDPRDFCFGFGRRRCPGIVFAEESMFALFSMVLAVYDISKATENGRVVEPLMEGQGTIISHPAPFGFTVKPRSDKAQALLNGLAADAQHASSH